MYIYIYTYTHSNGRRHDDWARIGVPGCVEEAWGMVFWNAGDDSTDDACSSFCSLGLIMIVIMMIMIMIIFEYIYIYIHMYANSNISVY